MHRIFLVRLKTSGKKNTQKWYRKENQEYQWNLTDILTDLKHHYNKKKLNKIKKRSNSNSNLKSKSEKIIKSIFKDWEKSSKFKITLSNQTKFL